MSLPDQLQCTWDPLHKERLVDVLIQGDQRTWLVSWLVIQG